MNPSQRPDLPPLAPPTPPHSLSRAVTMACLALAGGSVPLWAANPLSTDPTQPPPGFQRNAPRADGMGGGSTAATSPSAAAPHAGGTARAPTAPTVPPAPLLPPPPPEPLPALQGLHLTGAGGASAMVDGRLVRAGDSVAGRRILGIDAGGVALQGSQGVERLQLLAGAAKLPAGTITVSRSTSFSAAPTRMAAASAPAAGGSADDATPADAAVAHSSSPPRSPR
mgnify:CR=1 FL=1